MNRTGLLVALALAAGTGLVFGLWPDLDLAISRLFYREGTGFTFSHDPFWDRVRDVAMWVVAALIGWPIIAGLLKLARPESRMRVPGRVVLFLVSTILLGPLLMANMGFKDNWSRPRPRDVVTFGGSEPFRPWWDPRGSCHVNCSFVAGEASGAFWTLAPAALAPPTWRPLAYAAALTFGAATGLLRIAFGGHFFSDVVFAGVFTFLIIWAVHGLLYRGRPRISDDAIEAAIARLGRALRRPFGGRPDPRGDA